MIEKGTRNDLYAISKWGEGYFDIDPEGYLRIQPNNTLPSIRCVDLLDRLKQQGIGLPVLIRFPDILINQVIGLINAFRHAITKHNYQAEYTFVYPIKVNQHRGVIETIMQAQRQQNAIIGLEAGSKPEFLALLALVRSEHALLICNGYKDSQYIRLALLARQLGHIVYIVVEKLSELETIFKESRALKQSPVLGIRLKLSSIGRGHWQNTGGEKSKFGLSAVQVLQAVQQLQAEGRIQSLTMLHVHLGSQIACISDIRRCLQEVVRFFIELCAHAPIDTVNVGGGLAVDYDGTASAHNPFSRSYTVQDYTDEIVQAFSEGLRGTGLSHPKIVTESGRAITAHHAILLTDFVDWECTSSHQNGTVPLLSDPMLSSVFQAFEQRAQAGSVEQCQAIFHELMQRFQTVQTQYRLGALSLAVRAAVEVYYQKICRLLRDRLAEHTHADSIILDRLNELLADKIFVNCSFFRSLPDVWGIDQIFPITPIQSLNDTLDQSVRLYDITCDSDGRIDHYVSHTGISTSLPVPSDLRDQPAACLVFFMVGAYQEILGDRHNLFGETHAVDVSINADGHCSVESVRSGDSIATVLQSVHFELDWLEHALNSVLLNQTSDQTSLTLLRSTLFDSLSSYTYLHLSESDSDADGADMS